MQNFDFTILYTSNMAESIAFYARFFGRAPVEASATFSMFAFDNKVMLGLWGRDGVVPPVAATAGASEVAFIVGDDEGVEALHQDWIAQGVTIAQPPTRLDFGYSAVALDPDGHRLRVMRLDA